MYLVLILQKKYRVRVEHTGRSSIEREPESAYENA